MSSLATMYLEFENAAYGEFLELITKEEEQAIVQFIANKYDNDMEFGINEHTGAIHSSK